LINMNFIFDNISSQDMGLYIVRIGGSGEISSPFIPAQNIVETKLNKKHTPLFHRIEKQPLEFEIVCSLLEGEFTPEKKMELVKWLCKEYYCSFISEDNPNLIYEVIMTNQSDLMTFGNLQGYFTIQFRANSPWGYSPIYQENFNLSEITIPTVIEISNYSNAVQHLYPEIEFTLSGISTGISLINLSNAGEESIFTNLSVEEKIYINNERKQIISDLGLYRLGNFNKKWFRLVYGINRIQITGKCTISFRYRFPLLA